MIKQIFGKIPRKPSKSSHNNSNGEGGFNDGFSLNSSSNNTLLKSNSVSSKSSSSCSVGSRSGNETIAQYYSNQSKKSAPTSGSVMASAAYEALPSYKVDKEQVEVNLL